MENSNKKNTIKSYVTLPWRLFKSQVTHRPFTMFLVVLGLFVALIALSSAMQKPKTESKKEEKQVMEVNTYYIGTSPKVQLQAQVKKAGVITIYAQSAGVVQQVYKREGDNITKGSPLLWISTTYNGGTIATTQRQLAEANYNSTKSNLQKNKEAIETQRQIAQASRDNTEKLRQITEESIDETRGVVETNDSVLHNIVTNIEGMQATGSGTPSQIDSLKAQQAQLQAGINQLRNANRNAEYQVNKDNPPTKIADLQEQLALKQLDLQEKSLDLQLELTRLNLQVAQINEAFNYPSSPIAGTIEHINVQFGDMVTPGQIVATITTNNNAATVEVLVPQAIAQKASRTENSVIQIENQTIEVTPGYISTQPTVGSLYSIKYTLPTDNPLIISNNSYVIVNLPVGSPNTGSAVPFIPLDSVYQTQDGAYVYIAEKNGSQTKATTKKINLGQVIGSYVEVESGLSESDVIITDRNVVEGDVVMTKEQGLAQSK